MPAGLRPVASLNLIPSIALVPKTILSVSRATRAAAQRNVVEKSWLRLFSFTEHGTAPDAGAADGCRARIFARQSTAPDPTFP
jgi:hypothetical protein